jgi:hypothetical protein
MSFKPHSAAAAAYMMQVSEKHKKIAKAKSYDLIEDPEKLNREAEKAEILKNKSRKRMEEARKKIQYGNEQDDAYYRGNSRLQNEFDNEEDDEGICI